MSKADTEILESVQILDEISSLLETGLSHESLLSILSICSNDVNPAAVSAAIDSIREEQ